MFRERVHSQAHTTSCRVDFERSCQADPPRLEAGPSKTVKLFTESDLSINSYTEPVIGANQSQVFSVMCTPAQKAWGGEGFALVRRQEGKWPGVKVSCSV